MKNCVWAKGLTAMLFAAGCMVAGWFCDTAGAVTAYAAGSTSATVKKISIDEEYFPDEAFRKVLLEKYDTGKDGYLYSELKTLQSMDVSGAGISDLTGIEYFIDLRTLECNQNNLSSLDISGMSKLTHLYCNDNELTNLNVSAVSGLYWLECNGNKLQNLEVKGLSKLYCLSCNDNELCGLDVSGCTELMILYANGNGRKICCLGEGYALSDIPDFDVTKVTAWNGAVYDPETDSLKNLTGTTVRYAYDCGQNIKMPFEFQVTATVDADGDRICDNCGMPIVSSGVSINEENFPDEAFRKVLLEKYDSGKDGVLLGELTGTTKLSVDGSGIYSLVGIEHFASLETLSCNNNNLTSLDVSSLKTLKELRCNDNALIELNVSGCTSLEYLSCDRNNLRDLDVSDCTKLVTLNCNENNLSRLDVNGLKELGSLSCNYNNLYYLDVSECTSLESLSAWSVRVACDYGETFPLASLQELDLSKVIGWSGAEYDAETNSLKNLSESISYRYDCGRGFAAEIYLSRSLEDADHDRHCDICGRYIDGPYVIIDETNFPDETFRKVLKEKYDDKKDGVLMHELTQITDLSVAESGITDLTGVQHFTNLESLSCRENELTGLDLSCFKNLRYLYCTGNKLSSLDVSSCPDLRYLSCDENELSSLNVSGCMELEQLYCYDNKLISLDVSGCTKLEQLDCGTNRLEYLDVSGCTELEYIYCSYNFLEHLDVSTCAALDMLYCSNNTLESLNVNGCTNLKTLVCQLSGLPHLDVSTCSSLEKLDCFGNGMRMTSLNVSGLTSLRELACDMTSITALDLSACTALETLTCELTDITQLDVSACKELKTLLCGHTDLTHIDVSECTELSTFSLSDCQVAFCNVGEYLYLSELPGFDAARMSNLTGATYDAEKNALVDWGSLGSIDYTYDCGNGYTADFEIVASFDHVYNSGGERYCAFCGYDRSIGVEASEMAEGIVKHVYNVMLGFYATLENHDDLVEGILSGTCTGAQVVESVFESKEFQDRNLSDEEFVSTIIWTLYRDAPIEEELKVCKEILELGYSRRFLLGYLVNSESYRAFCEYWGFAWSEFYLTWAEWTPGLSEQEFYVWEFVERLYVEVLGRIPSEEELMEWVDRLLDEGWTGAAVAEGFVMSPEFINKNLTHEEFVQTMYRVFLDRDADPEGLVTWTGLLDNGCKKTYVFAGFANSVEFGNLCAEAGITQGRAVEYLADRQTGLSEQDYKVWCFVERMYTEVLKRTADESGVRTWVGVLQDGSYTGVKVADGFLMSEEFLAKDMTNEEYVQIMYRAFFNRDADPEGLATWTNALANGYTKQFVFAGFANSNEFGVLCEQAGIVKGTAEEQ